MKKFFVLFLSVLLIQTPLTWAQGDLSDSKASTYHQALTQLFTGNYFDNFNAMINTIHESPHSVEINQFFKSHQIKFSMNPGADLIYTDQQKQEMNSVIKQAIEVYQKAEIEELEALIAAYKSYPRDSQEAASLRSELFKRKKRIEKLEGELYTTYSPEHLVLNGLGNGLKAAVGVAGLALAVALTPAISPVVTVPLGAYSSYLAVKGTGFAISNFKDAASPSQKTLSARELKSHLRQSLKTFDQSTEAQLRVGAY